jgi:SAM-dependent methyltransferase
MSDDIRSETFASKEGAFDFIFMFQVVEHMDRLDALFERIRYVLKPGGSVFLTVPNPVRTEFQETHGSLLDMPPNHIGRFTERAFFKLAKTAGLTVTSAEFEPFDALHFLKEDIVFSFSRRAQNPASLAHSLRKLPRGFFSKAVQAAGAALSAPSRLGAWRDAFANRSHMGASLWVQIDRP